MTITVKNAAGTEKHLSASGDGTELNPYVPDHEESNSAAILAAAQAIETAVEGTLTVSGTVTTGGLTDVQLRASAVPVSGTVTASGPLTDTQLRAAAVPVSTDGLTDAELRADHVPTMDANGAAILLALTGDEGEGIPGIPAIADSSQGARETLADIDDTLRGWARNGNNGEVVAITLDGAIVAAEPVEKSIVHLCDSVSSAGDTTLATAQEEMYIFLTAVTLTNEAATPNTVLLKFDATTLYRVSLYAQGDRVTFVLPVGREWQGDPGAELIISLSAATQVGYSLSYYEWSIYA